MNTKKCPKCSAEMINVTTGEASERSVIQHAPFQTKIAIDRYLCLSCGFTEEWVNSANLEKAKKVFKGQ